MKLRKGAERNGGVNDLKQKFRGCTFPETDILVLFDH